MHTRVVQVDPQKPDVAAVREAAAIIRAGGLVAFPTETVYGLGANALDVDAVSRLFAAKGRPPTNPVIVHVGAAAEVSPLVRDFPEMARRLTERFWPGPLTLVLAKSARVPDIVTAGGPTVAVRVPGHPLALSLLEACGLPVAAPSANPSTRLSTTTAAHVLRGLGGRIDMILDAGPTPGGVESTVLDVSVSPPQLLRPGLVTRAALEAVIGPMVVDDAGGRSASGGTDRGGPTVHLPDAETALPARSPGQQERHYAPRTPLECVADADERIAQLLGQARRIGRLTHREVAPMPNVVLERLPADAAGYAAGLFAALHRLDDAGVDVIVVDEPPAADAWLAVRDRLRRAARSPGRSGAEN
jgi:L-threonylcarbamoyladenylate synthase